MNTSILFVLEEGVWDSKIIVWMDSDWQLSWNWIPWVLMLLPNRSITKDHHGHLIIGGRWPEDLNLLSLGIGDNLPREICLISLVEYIDSVIDNYIGIVDLLIWGEPQLLDPECLLSGETWSSSHQLLNVSRLRGVVPRASHLTVYLSDVLHSVWSIIWWYRSRLPDWMNMSHVIDRWWWILML